MAQDLQKRLERARRSLEKNKLRDAIADYQAVLELAPDNLEALQSLGTVYIRQNDAEPAAHYFGLQFEILLRSGDLAKASAVFSRFLRSTPQPPDRLMRYAVLLQQQTRPAEAVEQYEAAARLFKKARQNSEALTCLEKITQLDPENSARYLSLAEMAEGLGRADVAARAYMRAGQLTQVAGARDKALQCFARGHDLAPQDRMGSLLYAEARLRSGDAAAAVTLLEPLASSDSDQAFLSLYGDALLQTGLLDRARQALESYYTQKQDNFTKLFDLALAYLRAGQDDRAVQVITLARARMKDTQKENEFVAQSERVAAAAPKSQLLAEFVAQMYEDLNRESKYFDALVRLFDLNLEANRIPQACANLDRMIDIDPYDHRNSSRLAQLEGKATPDYLRGVYARTPKPASGSPAAKPAPPAAFSGTPGVGNLVSAPPVAVVPEEKRTQQALEDLIVQVEIFLQYSLQAKAVERLERIAELFPGEEERNERLRAVYERASWWPKRTAPPVTAPPSLPVAVPGPGRPGTPASNSPSAGAASSVAALTTHRDLAAIAETTRLMYRQATPREVLFAAVQQVARHLDLARALVWVGAPGEKPLTAEFAAPGLNPIGTSQLMGIALSLLEHATPDALGGIDLQAATVPALRKIGLESAMGILLTDKETQAPAGALLVGDTGARSWQPNVSFFMHAVGDQVVLSTNHSRLRSLVRSLSVADEKTGLLSRGGYIDCLMAEANRSRSQNTALSLLVLLLDHGSELLRQHGDAPVERYIERLARTLGTNVRQTDIAVKYTAWSLAFILPDTSAENALVLAGKLRQTAATIPTPWEGPGITMSMIVADASRRPADDIEDCVTEWINRVETGLDQLRQTEGSGSALVTLKSP
ncbi:MAG: tetratricopeptide repeat protein [Candidatus Acidiferrales bacterium]